MTLRLIALILICKVAHVSDACADSENQVPKFCWGGQVLHQAYCPDFENYSQYTCVGGSSVGCACKKELFRAVDGQCVQRHECAARAHREADIRSGTYMKRVGDAAGKTLGEVADITLKSVAVPEATYEATVPADDIHVAATQLIQSPDILELLMMSEDSWVHDQCLCLKSTRFADTLKGAERTVDCYAYRKRLIVPDTIENLRGTPILMKITREMEITVGEHGG
ncbi:hypothetical protein MTO96_037957 [Rhipicephalus appendiculatus]